MNILSKRGKCIHKVVGDGNCLFRALAFILYGTEDDRDKVKLCILEFEGQNGDLYREFVPEGNTSLEDHIQALRKPNAWGTHFELKAAATVYQMDVRVFMQISSTTDYHELDFHPYKLQHPLVKPPLAKEIDTLELCHTNNNHFDCIVDKKEDVPSECPTLPHSVSHFS